LGKISLVMRRAKALLEGTTAPVLMGRLSQVLKKRFDQRREALQNPLAGYRRHYVVYFLKLTSY
jgi:hypothetical protein